MEGTITALVPQGRRGDQRWNVFLDGRYAFSLQAATVAGLRVGQVLSAEEVERLLGNDLDRRAAEAGLALLARRPRSEHEVRQRLARRYPAEAVERALDKLREWRLIDDAAFARYWVEQRQHFRPRGARLLRRELRQKGIAAELAEEAATSGGDDTETAFQAARAQARRWHALDAATFRQRLGAFLARRGFDWETINSVVRRVWSDLQDETTQEGSGTRPS